MSGIVATFTSWEAVLWLQTAMTGVGALSSAIFLPDIRRPQDTPPLGAMRKLTTLLKDMNPSKVFKVMFLPNVFLTVLPDSTFIFNTIDSLLTTSSQDISCGLLSWSQYTLLAAPRHLLNPRFGLTTPLVSGLFYIAPGVGFLLGTVVGGRLADMTVIKWIKNRDGLRLPQDRLHSGTVAFFFITPVSSLIYGWGLQYEVGGLALPITTAFFCALGLLMSFASMNTYCAEVLPKQRTEVIASKYFVQYCFAAAGSASMVPLIDAIGIGLASTIGE